MLGCVYGGLGIVQAVQNTLNKLWGVPRDSRPNPVKAWLRSLLLPAFGGVSVIVTTVLAALGAAGRQRASRRQLRARDRGGDRAERDLTPADRRAYISYAKTERHKTSRTST